MTLFLLLDCLFGLALRALPYLTTSCFVEFRCCLLVACAIFFFKEIKGTWIWGRMAVCVERTGRYRKRNWLGCIVCEKSVCLVFFKCMSMYSAYLA